MPRRPPAYTKHESWLGGLTLESECAVTRKKQSNRKSPKQLFFEIQKLEYDKCLAGELNSCDQPAIRAHSIQNSQNIMGLIARDGHVVMIRAHMTDASPELRIETVGRNKASTFVGLCARHDGEVFRALDTVDLNPSDQEQLFLLAYRALLREQQVLMTGGLRLQRAADEIGGAAEITALQFQLNAYTFDVYRRTYFDPVLVSGDFEAIEHDVIEVSTKAPTVAVSSLFSLDEVDRPGDVVRSALSVLPISRERSIAVFSYTQDDAGLARRALDAILTAADRDQRLELSRLILDSAENFIVSPAFVDEWDQEKTETIKQIAYDSIFTIRQSPPLDTLMLFI